MIHPQDANERKIGAGDTINIFNDRGQFTAIADVTEDIRKGVVYDGVGYWDSMMKTNAGVNAVTDDRHTDMGQSGAYSDLLVQVEKAS